MQFPDPLPHWVEAESIFDFPMIYGASKENLRGVGGPLPENPGPVLMLEPKILVAGGKNLQGDPVLGQARLFSADTLPSPLEVRPKGRQVGVLRTQFVNEIGCRGHGRDRVNCGRSRFYGDP